MNVTVSTEDRETLAGELYTTYCAAVGGKSFNGDDLPTWKIFRADTSNKIQSDAWTMVAMRAIVIAHARPQAIGIES
jgi:hypothetical protein